MKLNERFTWAISIMAIQPTDKVLEVGCGTGILAGQIVKKLTKGLLTAIDRSSVMISLTSKRIQASGVGGKVKLLTTNFATADLKRSKFDKAVAFNVNFFWKDSKTEMQKIRQCLKPGGKLFVFYQAPYEIDIRVADPIKKNLERNDFEVTDTIIKSMRPTSTICIVSTTKTKNQDERSNGGRLVI